MIYIMRHGQTNWNITKKLQGRTDIPLNENGREMARIAKEKYKHTHFDICYVSPLSRARETAEIFLDGRNIPIIVDERLTEMSFGEFEGLDNAPSQTHLSVSTLFKDPVNFKASKDGESLEDLYKRTKSFIDEIIIPAKTKNIDLLVVAHGALNLSIINQINEIPLEHFWDNLPANCEIFEI